MVSRSVDDAGVALLTLRGPDAENAWSMELGEAYLAALRELEADPAVRAVVLMGAGDTFCRGGTPELREAISGDPAWAGAFLLEPVHFAKPLIAAISGAAAGIGFLQALLADVRFAASDTVFSTAPRGCGDVAEAGMAWLLTQVAGRGTALDLMLSAREVDAEEAQRLRLVHRVGDPGAMLDSAVAYARDVASMSSPASVNVIKHQVTAQATMSVSEVEEASRTFVAESLAGADFAEGVASYLERRPPRFAPLAFAPADRGHRLEVEE
ncbi:enoyl-CoA hydratase-related protein [Aeromicrobium sp. CF4.19]|uniref:enoyl-CoA hydratase-related protein n=1 Tax=Aeromicrobium sp. CF4.19 TaxID=3373082 RepID=UPI003EE7ABC6